MPGPPLPFDAMTLSRMGMATWLTDVIVARKWGEAIYRQYALMFEGLRPVPYGLHAD